MAQSGNAWPGDVDGDVLRRMDEDGFDFSKPVEIDFNIDFESWPPPEAALARIRERHPDARVVEPGEGDDEDDDGYVQVVVNDVLSYELVMRVQRELSALAEPFGGVCESWGAWSQDA